MHGVQTPPSAANPGMPVIPKAMVYASAYHLMATREIFLALLRAYGVSLEEPVANGLCLLSPAAFLDAVIDRHNHNGVMAVLALGVRDSCLTLIRGVLAAFGTRRAAAYSSRDLGADLPTLLIVSPCSCLEDFDKTTESYKLLLERQRADRLKSTPVVQTPVPASLRASEASDLALFAAWKRGAHIDDAEAAATDRKPKAQTRMPPTRVRDGGKAWECGKAVYDLSKGHELLKELQCEDGDETCLMWQLLYPTYSPTYYTLRTPLRTIVYVLPYVFPNVLYTLRTIPYVFPNILYPTCSPTYSLTYYMVVCVT
jgi:hypothetical protein